VLFYLKVGAICQEVCVIIAQHLQYQKTQKHYHVLQLVTYGDEI